jgi:hypothetical protein
VGHRHPSPRPGEPSGPPRGDASDHPRAANEREGQLRVLAEGAVFGVGMNPDVGIGRCSARTWLFSVCIMVLSPHATKVGCLIPASRWILDGSGMPPCGDGSQAGVARVGPACRDIRRRLDAERHGQVVYVLDSLEELPLPRSRVCLRLALAGSSSWSTKSPKSRRMFVNISVMVSA